MIKQLQSFKPNHHKTAQSSHLHKSAVRAGAHWLVTDLNWIHYFNLTTNVLIITSKLWLPHLVSNKRKTHYLDCFHFPLWTCKNTAICAQQHNYGSTVTPSEQRASTSLFCQSSNYSTASITTIMTTSMLLFKTVSKIKVSNDLVMRAFREQ